MKGTSKFIMGATLVMVLSLAIVLGLILVLLAELYCSLLLHRRQLRKTNSNTNTIPISTTQTTTTISSSPLSLSLSLSLSHTPHSPPTPFTNNVYSQGVLQAPRTFLFPCKDYSANATTPRGIGLVSVSQSPLASFLARAPPQQLQVSDTANGIQYYADNNNNNNKSSGGVEHLVYISNPIYEEGQTNEANTPFETPHTSPSLLERSGSSGDDDVDHVVDAYSPTSLTPPLTPMKKLPAEGSSVSLRDATSLGTSASDSHSVNGPSSSSSDSPSTSPSW